MINKGIILGSNDRAALETIRILGSSNHIVDNIYFSEKTICNYSRYLNDSFFLGDPENNYIFFVQNLISFLRENNYNYLVPINDIANEIIFNNYNRISKLTYIASTSKSSYLLCHSKYKSLSIAKKCGFKVPKTNYVKSINELDYRKFKNYPLFSKPEFSVIFSNGFLNRTNVRKVNNLSELKNNVRENILNSPLLIQEKVNGHGVGINIYAEKGKLIELAVTRRIHEPINGGASSYRKSIKISKKLKLKIKSLVDQLKIDGVSMIELKYDGKNYWFMEINSRLWGSLKLSSFSGINFVKLLLSKKFNFKINNHYKPDRYARFFTTDIKWMSKKLISGNIFLFIKELIQGMYRIIFFKEVIDEFNYKDVKPFFLSIQKVILSLNSKIKFNLSKKLKVKGINNINRSSKILFVCKGNINRSVFAEFYINNKYKMKTNSCGIIKKRNRMCSYQLLQISNDKFKIDVSEHKSRYIGDVNLKYYDKIIVFDNQILDYFKNSNTNIINKLFLLSVKPIEDPYDKNMETYNFVFKTISNRIDYLCSTLN